MIRSDGLRHLHLGCGESLRSRLLGWTARLPEPSRRGRNVRRTANPHGRSR